MVNFAMGADVLVHEVINLDLYEAVLKTRPFFAGAAPKPTAPYETGSRDA
jgi:hypothetical protein